MFQFCFPHHCEVHNLKPLVFTLYDVLGNPISDENIKERYARNFLGDKVYYSKSDSRIFSGKKGYASKGLAAHFSVVAAVPFPPLEETWASIANKAGSSK